jgi:hypothetical protein
MSRTPIRERPDPEAVLPSMRAVQPHEEIAYSERLEQCFLAGVAPHHMKRPPKPAVPLQPGSMMSPKRKKKKQTWRTCTLVSRAVRRSRGFASTVTACCGQDEGRAAKNKKEATYIEKCQRRG